MNYRTVIKGRAKCTKAPGAKAKDCEHGECVSQHPWFSGVCKHAGRSVNRSFFSDCHATVRTEVKL